MSIAYPSPNDPQYEAAHEHVVPVEIAYSPFWPLFILVVGLVLWSGYQMSVAYLQASNLNADFKSATPTIREAQAAQSRLYAMAQDLIQTGAKDPYAAQIVKEANIQIKSNGTGSAGR